MKKTSELVALIQKHFRTFGGEQDLTNNTNPISHAINDQPAQFAAGVDVTSVVEFILSESKVSDIPGETPEEKWSNLQKYTLGEINKIDKVIAESDEPNPAWYLRMMEFWKKFHNIR